MTQEQYERTCQIHSRRRKSILKDIEKAKQLFVDKRSNFMCICFMSANLERYRDINRIRDWIPEFNRKFCGAKGDWGGGWWPAFDRESRIKAFDKLIKIYSE